MDGNIILRDNLGLWGSVIILIHETQSLMTRDKIELTNSNLE